VSKVAGRLRASVLAAIAMLRTAWTETSPRPVIAIVAKAPRAGQVKTRLIQHLGGEGAAELWSASLVDTAALLRVAAAELRAIARRSLHSSVRVGTRSRRTNRTLTARSQLPSRRPPGWVPIGRSW
jgi:hypothetical protein